MTIIYDNVCADGLIKGNERGSKIKYLSAIARKGFESMW